MVAFWRTEFETNCKPSQEIRRTILFTFNNLFISENSQKSQEYYLISKSIDLCTVGQTGKKNCIVNKNEWKNF